MNHEYALPELTENTTPSDYAFNLRVLLFHTLREVGAHLPVHFATVGAYEKPGGTTPPPGYLACLARQLVEKETEELCLNQREVAEYKELILAQLRELLHSKQRRRLFRNVTAPKSWYDLEVSADEFLHKQKALRSAAKKDLFGAATRQQSTSVQEAGVPFMSPPLPPQGVIGREEDLSRIREMLLLTSATSFNVPPLAIRGMGGVGKTTLTIALGRSSDVQELFPQGILWTELGPMPDVRACLNAWGRALGLDLRQEADEEACEVRLREALFHRRALLIVDDVWDINHGKHFMVGGPQCRTLITTRELPVAHALATRERTLGLDVLSPEAAMKLLGKFAPEVVASDPHTARRLCRRLECLPLAVKLAGRLLANEADVPSRMRSVLGELTEHREARLNLIQAEGDSRVEAVRTMESPLSIAEERASYGDQYEQPVSLHAILGMSVKRLSQRDQNRFARLSVFGREPLIWTVEEAVVTWACSYPEAEETMSHLVQRGIVEPRPGDSYWMHGLLADYAALMLDEREL